MQQLIFAEMTKPVQSLSVGLVHQLDSPFNLFVNLAQLLDPNQQHVHLFIYSMGKKTIAGWGLYDRKSRTFELDGYCKYLLPQLYPMTQYWRRHDYQYVGNTVTDRASSRIAEYLGTPVINYEEYKKWKHIIAWYNHEITNADLDSAYPDIFNQLPDNAIDLHEYIQEIQIKAKRYEKTINRRDMSRELLNELTPQLRDTLNELFDKFADYVSRSLINGWSVQTCPDLDFCRNNSGETDCEVYFSYFQDDYT